MLTRTLRNLEQAQGGVRSRTTAAEILQAPGNEEVGMTMPLPSDQAPAAGSVANSSNHSTAPAVFPTVVTLTRDLNTSTALLQNLRTRNSILAEDLARHHRETAAQRSSKAKWKVLAIILLVVWALYLWWCWHMCVEMEYIRKRRGEIYSGL